MNSARQPAIIFALMLLLAAAGWYAASSSHLNFHLDDQTLSQIPDAVVKDLTYKQFDNTGKLVNELRTDLLLHIPLKDQHWLRMPRVKVIEADQSQWLISAKQALATQGGEAITFKRDVVVHQPANGKHAESTFKTEEIIYYPKTKLAATDKAVRFEQPGTVVQSRGMRADLAEKRVQLLHQARGSYQSKQG